MINKIEKILRIFTIIFLLITFSPILPILPAALVIMLFTFLFYVDGTIIGIGIVIIGVVIVFHSIIRKKGINLYEVFIILLAPVISIMQTWLKIFYSSQFYNNVNVFNTTIMTILNILLCLNISFFLRNKENRKHNKISAICFYASIMIACITCMLFPIEALVPQA